MVTSRFNRSLVARLAPRPLRTPRVSVHSKLCVGRRPTFGDFAVAFCLAIGILISGCIVLLYIFRYLGSERSNFESIGDTDFCDVFDGGWVPDSSYPLYNSSECPFSERGFNCLANGRKDMDYLKWRWKPRQCDVPNFDAHDILERLRGKRVVFVGDSMSRTQWESLICMLMTGVQDPKTVYEVNGNQISKTIQFLGVHFQTFNLSIEFFRSVFLVQQSLPPRHWPKRVRTALKLDKMDNMNGKWVDSDVLIFNSGHWWTPRKLFDIGCYFQVGGALKLGMSINSAFRIALNTWASWIETKVNINRTHVFFRTYEPSHWSGSNQKVCNLTHQPLSEASENDGNEFADIIAEVVERMSVPATILNVTLMGAYRSDAHIGTWSYPPTVLDCSHWCLPGVPDAWNELVFSYLLRKGYLVSVQLAKGIRGVKTKPETSVIANDDKKDSKPCQDDFNPVSTSVGMLDGIDDKTNVNYRAYSNLKTSSRHDLAMIFTCRVCETRSVKTTCRESYEKGVVVARCSGCNNLHLIADRLGWFGEPGSVEDCLAARGEEVKKGSADTLNLTLEDLTGTKS